MLAWQAALVAARLRHSPLPPFFSPSAFPTCATFGFSGWSSSRVERIAFCGEKLEISMAGIVTRVMKASAHRLCVEAQVLGEPDRALLPGRLPLAVVVPGDQS